MNNKTKNQLLWLIVLTIVLVVGYMWYNPRVVEVEVPVVLKPQAPIQEVEMREPEFRGPPIKKYKHGVHATDGDHNESKWGNPTIIR